MNRKARNDMANWKPLHEKKEMSKKNEVYLIWKKGRNVIIVENMRQDTKRKYGTPSMPYKWNVAYNRFIMGKYNKKSDAMAHAMRMMKNNKKLPMKGYKKEIGHLW